MVYMKKIIGIVFALFMTFSAFAQSNKMITEMLNAEEFTYGQAVYLSAVFQGLIHDDDSPERALEALTTKGQITEVQNLKEPVSLQDLAFIYSKMWNVQGGLMFRITGGSPRYAFKQMKADGIIANRADPSKKLSGTEALSMFTSCSAKYKTEKMFTDNF